MQFSIAALVPFLAGANAIISGIAVPETIQPGTPFQLTGKMGRKWALFTSNVVFLIGAIVMTAATQERQKSNTAIGAYLAFNIRNRHRWILVIFIDFFVGEFQVLPLQFANAGRPSSSKSISTLPSRIRKLT